MRLAASWLSVVSLAAIPLAIACGGDEGQSASPDSGLLRPDARPAQPTSTSLVVTITEGEGGPPIPGRIVLYGEDDRPLRIGSKDMYDGLDQDRGFCDLSPGVIGTWDGIALIDGTGEMSIGEDGRCGPAPPIPFGVYRVVALQGIEHEMYETTVDLTERRGKVRVVAPLARAFTPTGALAADLHVHAFGSGDSLVPRDVRVTSELVTGIQVIGSSDHNVNGSYEEVIAALGLDGKIASLSSNEVSTSAIHANVFPVQIDPSQPRNGAPGPELDGLVTAGQLFSFLHALPRAPFVQLNHPRLRFAAYFDSAGWDGRSWPPPMPVDFDGVETVTGWYAFDVPSDPRLTQALTDLFTLLSHGKLVTATGNSDTHHLSSILAGMPRNYVFVDDATLAPFDEELFTAALRDRRVLVTTGPWLEIGVGGATMGGRTAATGGMVHVVATLRQASYIEATRLRVWVGGALRETVAIPAGAREWAWSGDVAVGATDTWVGLAVDGETLVPAVLHGEYLGHRAEVPGMQPFALANPVLVDADGDGEWRPPAAKPVVIPDFPLPPRGPGSDECAPPGAEMGVLP